MAITITAAQVALAIRAATDPEEIPEAVSTVLSFLVPAASSIVLAWAPSAPDAVHDAALIRLTGWLYDADPADGRSGQAMQLSGAASLLAPFRVHRAGIIDTPDDGPAPAPAPGGGVPAPPSAGNFILTSNNGELSWVAFPLPPL